MADPDYLRRQDKGYNAALTKLEQKTGLTAHAYFVGDTLQQVLLEPVFYPKPRWYAIDLTWPGNERVEGSRRPLDDDLKSKLRPLRLT